MKDTRDPRGGPTIELTLRRGVTRPVTGALFVAEAPSPGRPLLLFGHGASGDRYQAPIPPLARRFNALGYSALSLDGPVHGLRKVAPGGRTATLTELERPRALDDMLDDWHAAIAAVQALPEVGKGPLAYFGLSMGSLFGLPLVAARPDVSVATLGLLGSTGYFGAFGSRLLADAGRVRCPTLYLMQLQDELFDRDGYLALFDALATRDKRLHANPGLHAAVPAEEIAFAFDFMQRVLARSDRQAEVGQ